MRVVAVVLCLVLAATACETSSVSEAAAAFFIDCMAERGVEVDDVVVEVTDGRHIGRFSWQAPSDTDSLGAGEACERATLRRFEISRT